MMRLFCLYLLAFIAPAVQPAEAADLRVRIQQTNSDRGKILVLVFNSEYGFPDEVARAFQKFALTPRNGGVEFVLEDLPPGDYAFTVLHDEDNNEVMNTNLLGLPTEKYGFSNNPKIYFSAPSFDKAAVQMGSSNQTIHIDLR